MTAMIEKLLTLKDIEKDDCDLLFRWANDPDVRAFSFNTTSISLQEHREWFRKKLQDSDCIFLIALDAHSVPVGQIRFDCSENAAEIDVSVDREQRGRGYGQAIIKAGIDELVKRRKVRAVHAFVKADNQSSLKAFKAVGFINLRSIRVNAFECVQMELAIHD